MQRSVQILTVFMTLATVVACGTYGRGTRNPSPEYSATVVWDSGPIDRDYNGQRTELEARHSQEIANPRAGESAEQMKGRHAAESKDLDTRYAAGKASHSNSVPASDQGHDDRSR